VIETRDAYKILLRKRNARNYLGDKGMGCENVNWTELANK
jgi:hypothetical protein